MSTPDRRHHVTCQRGHTTFYNPDDQPPPSECPDCGTDTGDPQADPTDGGPTDG